MKLSFFALAKKKRLGTFLLVSLFYVSYVSSQIVVESKAKVENVNFGYVMDQVVITYDLSNARFGEKFTISLKVFTTDGEEIPARSTIGDIGENIKGEGRKKITWNIHRDIEKLDDNIYVVVEAELQNPKVIKPIDRKVGLVYSTVYPGYGGCRITGKKIHLLKGIAGYGLIGSAIIMRGQASKSYDSYKIETDLDKRDEYYNKVESQLLASTLLFAGAGAVWLSDYLTVLLAENKVLKMSESEPLVSIYPAFTPWSSTPGFGLRIIF